VVSQKRTRQPGKAAGFRPVFGSSLVLLGEIERGFTGRERGAGGRKKSHTEKKLKKEGSKKHNDDTDSRRGQNITTQSKNESLMDEFKSHAALLRKKR